MHAELVDRGGEVAAFQARLAAEVAGPGALVVSGEPGIGRTRLLAEFARRATVCGVRVIAGQACAREQDVPFAAVAEVITGLLRPPPGQPALPAQTEDRVKHFQRESGVAADGIVGSLTWNGLGFK